MWRFPSYLVFAACVTVALALLIAGESEIGGELSVGLGTGSAFGSTGGAPLTQDAFSNASEPDVAPLCSIACLPTAGPEPNQSGGLSEPAATPDGLPGNWVYWVWSFYQGPSYSPTMVWTSIETPSSGPVDGDQYAILLNVNDNQNYWDQIGLASDWGCGACGNPYNTWSIPWEQGSWGAFDGQTGCGWGGAHSRDAYDATGLSPLSWYTFAMQLVPRTDSLLFEVYYGQGQSSFENSPIWSQSETDPATAFMVGPPDPNCNGGGSGNADSLLEEVDNLGGSAPQDLPHWNFEFLDTEIALKSGAKYYLSDNDWTDTTAETCDTACPSIPQGYILVESGIDVLTIANEAFELTFWTDTIEVAPGQTVEISGFDQPVGSVSPTDYCVAHTCSESLSCTWPPDPESDECVFYNPVPQTVENGTAIYSFTPSSSTPAGVYYEGFQATISSTTPTQFTIFIFYIDVT